MINVFAHVGRTLAAFAAPVTAVAVLGCAPAHDQADSAAAEHTAPGAQAISSGVGGVDPDVDCASWSPGSSSSIDVEANRPGQIVEILHGPQSR